MGTLSVGKNNVTCYRGVPLPDAVVAPTGGYIVSLVMCTVPSKITSRMRLEARHTVGLRTIMRVDGRTRPLASILKVPPCEWNDESGV